MREFMDLAIGFEVESAEFYSRMSTSVNDDAVVGLLNRLESQERDHEKTLRAYHTPKGDETTFQFPPDLSLSMPVPGDDPDFMQMLSVAIEREHRSAEIYRAATERTSGQFRDMLQGLAGFEAEHEDQLKLLRESWS